MSVKPRKNVIEDGYNRDACILPVDGLHDGLLFTYRPMTAEQREAARDAMEGKTGPQSITIMANALGKHMVKWDEPAPMSVHNIKRLFPSLFDRLYGIVSGRLPSDPLPDGKGEEPNEYAVPPTGDEHLEAAAKN